MLFAILLVILSIVSFFIPRKWLYSYWTRREIPQLKPSFPFGDVWETFKQRRSYAQRTAELYNQAVRSKLRFVGIYIAWQPILLITDADLARRILNDDFHHFLDRGIYVNEAHDPLSANLFTLTGLKWRLLKKMLLPAFSTDKLKAMFPTMEVPREKLCKVINGHLEGPINIRDLMVRYTTDVIASVGFGVEEELPRSGMKSRNLMTSVRLFLTYVAPRINWRLQVKMVDDEVEKYILAVVREAVQRRENKGVIRNDFLQSLVQLRNQGEVGESWDVHKTDDQDKNLTVEEIAAQLYVILNAGSETASSTITFCMYELCRNRDYLTRAVQEIDDVMAVEGAEISYDALERMTFLESCIEETTRKYPISPILVRMCTEAYTIPNTETVIEKGTMVHIPLLGLHYDAAHFDDPFLFNPDRFTERGGAAHYPHYAFGAGKRHCIGERMGKLMIKLALVEMLSKYDFELSSTEPEGEIELDPSLLMLRPKQDIMFTPRQRNAN